MREMESGVKWVVLESESEMMDLDQWGSWLVLDFFLWHIIATCYFNILGVLNIEIAYLVNKLNLTLFNLFFRSQM